jgi:hypothetical protein
MERVVYVLGAGFSAPLGLPVMNDFLFKAKDLYFHHPDRYAHFEKVLKEVNKLSVVKNYYDSDQFNIEEILSILEMLPNARGSNLRKAFASLIEDVITYFTPPIAPYNGNLPLNWKGFVFGQDSRWKTYGYFSAALLGLTTSQREIRNQEGMRRKLDIGSRESQTKYGVVTFNYDRVLEGPSEYLSSQHEAQNNLGFRDPQQTDLDRPVIARLHGSVGQSNIVPPTWNKTVFKKIRPNWDAAFSLLSEANHIRFIGYSLPPSDAYARYLFKAAALQSPHLKSIDVLCRDPDGSVQENYDRFITFKYRRFRNADTLDYLKAHLDTYKAEADTSQSALNFDRLEAAHERFFQVG